MSLITAILAKNEQDNHLAEVLTRCGEFSDQILLLDDSSTDGTRDLAKRLGATVRSRKTEVVAWGTEAPARAELWDWMAKEAKDGWGLICDADMILHGDPLPYTKAWDCNAWAFILYDLWQDRNTYRSDTFWQGHTHPRPWLFRPSAVPSDYQPQWPDRGLHTGHCPLNFPIVAGLATDLAWYHLAYLTPEQRKKKHLSYMARKDQLTPAEVAHAESIIE